jgi:uncharacterized membrane protein YccC
MIATDATSSQAASETRHPFVLSTTAKEAIKTALAFTLVYWIALKSAWMNPYWAGWAVAMIALPTAGQSIHKGVLRLAGTVPACAAALAILGLAPQSRWGLILLTGAWVFFTTYKMLGSKNNSYFWNVAGFVSLIIVTTGPASPESAFAHAVFRTLETGMGVIVYTLVSVLIWPRTNAGAIKKSATELLRAQATRLHAIRASGAAQDKTRSLGQLHAQEVSELAALGAALQAEGSESYQVHEQRPRWERMLSLATEVSTMLDRLQVSWRDDLDLEQILPDLQAFCEALEARFGAALSSVGGDVVEKRAVTVALGVDRPSLRSLSPLDRASVVVIRRQLEDLERYTEEMLSWATALADPASKTRLDPVARSAHEARARFTLPVLDRDHLRGAMLVVATLVVGFLIWVYVNPPGHVAWVQFPASVAMAVAGAQQLTATKFVKPVAVASALTLGVYVFVMPSLSTFVGLGSVIFACMFINCFFFTGLARFAGMVGILNELSIQNHQTYDFAAMANGYVFTLLGFVLVFFMSYMIRSPRPEKAVLHSLSRFFRSAELLISQPPPEEASSPFRRWRSAFHHHEIRTMPSKIEAWCKAIDGTLFPSNEPEQTQTLVTALRSIANRIEELLEARSSKQSARLARALSDDVAAWRHGIELTLRQWVGRPEAEVSPEIRKRLANWLADLQEHVDSATDNLEHTTVGEEELEGFYRVLGGYRGVSEALSAYANAASAIDWGEWRQERFT